MIVSVLAVIVASEFHASSTGAAPKTSAGTSYETPVLSNIELTSAAGFISSTLAAGPNTSTLLVLSLGGTGTIPFTVYSSANVSFTASLSVYSGSKSAAAQGVQFNVSPANFTVNPRQQVTCTLTVTADKDASSVFYLPTIGVQTNRQDSAPYIGGGPICMPALLVSNFTPSCLILVNEQELSQTQEPTILPVTPTVSLAPGQSSIVIFGCLTQDALSLSASPAAGLTAQFSATPTNIVFGYTSGNMYALTITAAPSMSAGTYQVKTNATLGSYPFTCSFTFAVS